MQTYKIWAPESSHWSRWAKPVAFANPPSAVQDTSADWMASSVQETVNVSWRHGLRYDTAVILDMPGDSGVPMAVALAGIGYRPVPLYNGVQGDRDENSAVAAGAITAALYSHAHALERLNLREDAPPVFMLDGDRMKTTNLKNGSYDNRWCIFPQDMPSADYLLSKQILNVLVYGPYAMQHDLAHVLLRYREKGIQISVCDTDGYTKTLIVEEPSTFKSIAHRLITINELGLSKNPAGGFGGKMTGYLSDRPSSSSSGARSRSSYTYHTYYRMG